MIALVNFNERFVPWAVARQGEYEEHSSALLTRVEKKLVGEAEKILEAAKSKNDFRGANGALGAACKLLDLCGRLSGQLQSANAGVGIHLTKITNVNVTSYGDDREIALLVAEATKSFDSSEIERLKALAKSVQDGRSSATTIS